MLDRYRLWKKIAKKTAKKNFGYRGSCWILCFYSNRFKILGTHKVCTEKISRLPAIFFSFCLSSELIIYIRESFLPNHFRRPENKVILMGRYRTLNFDNKLNNCWTTSDFYPAVRQEKSSCTSQYRCRSIRKISPWMQIDYSWGNSLIWHSHGEYAPLNWILSVGTSIRLWHLNHLLLPPNCFSDWQIGLIFSKDTLLALLF